MTEQIVTTQHRREITIPDFAMVALVGSSGSGKSTFAARHFASTEILSSDRYRGFVDDDENSLEATKDAFAALHYMAGVRLRRRRLVVVDATNVQKDSRAPLVSLAHQHDALAIAIVIDLPEEVCQARNALRPDRTFGPHVIRNHTQQLRRGLRSLSLEGFRYVHVLRSVEEIDSVMISRQPTWTDRRSLTGQFDIIGDVHGCYDELVELLVKLENDPADLSRRLIFLGDLVDRGPKVVEVCNLVMDLVESGKALCVPGNHDVKLARYLSGKRVTIAHGLHESIDQIEALDPTDRDRFIQRYLAFVDSLVSHFWMDEGRLVVAHAGMKEEYQGRASGRVREFALYGETSGEIDEFGLPVRLNWAESYRGKAKVVYGHTPVPTAEWLNNTINLDTGCVFGGALTALRYPDGQIVQVKARQLYAAPARPFLEGTGSDLSSLQWQSDELLRAEDVTGKRFIETRLSGKVTIQAENAAAAFEVISRFAVEPRWLVYLPPTMSPAETSSVEGYLERPEQAFEYFARAGVNSVVCQTKHMGSRAVIVLCRNEEVASARFGAEGGIGVCYTRTGRSFFDSENATRGFLDRLLADFDRAGFWETHDTDWAALDAEIMPWNAKAQQLLREQYIPVGEAARSSVTATLQALEASAALGGNVADLLNFYKTSLTMVEGYTAAYQHYCWEVSDLESLKVAPFQLLATEGAAHFDKSHEWHVEQLRELVGQDSIFVETDCLTVDLGSEDSRGLAIDWWTSYTQSGGEGMVVKPLAGVVRGEKGLVQPAIKVRGREYLRIIYGPEYTRPENLERLRKRGLSHKRSLALREFALGVEALERFVRREPLRHVHECVFGVLALESEPVDPRL